MIILQACEWSCNQENPLHLNLYDPCMPKICLTTKTTLGKVSKHDPSTKSKIWQPPPLPQQCNEILIVQRQGKPHYPPQLMLEHERKNMQLQECCCH
jgi:hypothetical protein